MHRHYPSIGPSVREGWYTQNPYQYAPTISRHEEQNSRSESIHQFKPGPARFLPIIYISRILFSIVLRGRSTRDKLNKTLFDFGTFVPVPWLNSMRTLRWMAIEFSQKIISLRMRSTIAAVKVCQSYAMAIAAHSRYYPQSLGPDEVSHR